MAMSRKPFTISGPKFFGLDFLEVVSCSTLRDLPTADAAPDASPTPTSHLSPSVSLYVVSWTTRVLLVSTPLEPLPRELPADVFAPSPAMTPSSSNAVLTRWSRRRVR